MKMQKGFTLIELMVVIVIIGILSALAVPKMFGVSAKAKAAEAPGVLANWETLQSAYVQETSTAGTLAQIGFADPSATSKWFDYAVDATSSIMTATVEADKTFGTSKDGFTFVNTLTLPDTYIHSGDEGCTNYTPNFLP